MVMVSLAQSRAGALAEARRMARVPHEPRGLPPGWESKDVGGRTLFMDHGTQTTTWDRPTPSLLPPDGPGPGAGAPPTLTQVVTREHLGVASLARPIALRYRSRVLVWARTALFVVPLVLGIMEETQTMSVRLFDGLVDNSSQPYTWASVAITSPRFQVYGARLKVHADMDGLSYLVHSWFFSSLVVGTLSLTALFFAGTVLAAAAYYYWAASSRDGAAAASEETPWPWRSARRASGGGLAAAAGAGPQTAGSMAASRDVAEEAIARDSRLVYDEQQGIYVFREPASTSSPAAAAAGATPPATGARAGQARRHRAAATERAAGGDSGGDEAPHMLT